MQIRLSANRSLEGNTSCLIYLLMLAEFQALFEKLVNGSTTADRKAAAQDVVEQMKAGGAASFAVSPASALPLAVATVALASCPAVQMLVLPIALPW